MELKPRKKLKMNKVPYEIIAVEVDKLYPPIYVLKPNETLDEHLDFIETFITSCGWDMDEFLKEYLHRTNLIINPESN